MARVLLYNFRNEARRKKVKALLFRLALPSREVEPEEQGYPLGTLLGASGTAHEEPAAPENRPEMIRIHPVERISQMERISPMEWIPPADQTLPARADRTMGNRAANPPGPP